MINEIVKNSKNIFAEISMTFISALEYWSPPNYIWRKLSLLAFGYALFLCSDACVADVLDWTDSAKVAIEKKYPSAKIKGTAFGELSAGLTVVVFVVQDPQAYWVSILRRDEGRVYEWKRSGRIEVWQRLPEPEVKSHSIFLHDFSNSLDYAWNTNDQYQLRNGELVRIGREYLDYSPVWDDQPGPRHRSKESTNYLTGLTRWQEQVDTKTTHGEKQNEKIPLMRIEEFEGLGRTGE